MNSEFQFKQFSLRNANSALKINTDGVLLGAWTDCAGATCIWDVGTGTGVIALMMAQRCDATIFGIEIDDIAVEEAGENFQNSPWRERISVVEGDINKQFTTLPTPDLIVSNPPYFTSAAHNLKSPDQRKCSARHDDALSYQQLITLSSQALTTRGRLAFISPADREDDIQLSLTLAGMSVIKKLTVRTSARKPVTRILWLTAKGQSEPLHNAELIIHSADGSYTDNFKHYVKEFYINL